MLLLHGAGRGVEELQGGGGGLEGGAAVCVGALGQRAEQARSGGLGPGQATQGQDQGQPHGRVLLAQQALLQARLETGGGHDSREHEERACAGSGALVGGPCSGAGRAQGGAHLAYR